MSKSKDWLAWNQDNTSKGFIEITLSPPKGEDLVALLVFVSQYFFTNNHTFSSIFM
jgi:hypothetical protein